MNLKIKRLDVEMEIKNSGLEVEVRSPDGKILKGDLVISKGKLTWCKGKTRLENGVSVKWDKFIEFMETQ